MFLRRKEYEGTIRDLKREIGRLSVALDREISDRRRVTTLRFQKSSPKPKMPVEFQNASKQVSEVIYDILNALSLRYEFGEKLDDKLVVII